MPQTIEKYRILVASPSDVKDERETVDEVVKELNLTYGARVNIVIEVIKWETHSAPAASETSVQDKIDKDFGNDYDLFIGVLWKKFGTPTGKYGSGTEQEFRNAYQKFIDNPNSLQILFYFKTASPTSLSEIDPNELQKVNSFKISLGEKGILYWEYNSIEDFQRFLRLHVQRRLDELKRNSGIQQLIKQEEIVIISSTEELGSLDYQEIVEDSFNDATNAITQIAVAIKWVGNEISKKADEFTSITSSEQQVGKKNLRDFFSRTAEVLNDFVERVEPEIPIFIKNFERGTEAYASLITILRTDFTIPANEIEDLKNNLESLKGGLEGALSGTNSFLSSVVKLPRIEKEFNKARGKTEIVLKELINKLEVFYAIVLETRKSLNQ